MGKGQKRKPRETKEEKGTEEKGGVETKIKDNRKEGKRMTGGYKR